MLTKPLPPQIKTTPFFCTYRFNGVQLEMLYVAETKEKAEEHFNSELAKVKAAAETMGYSYARGELLQSLPWSSRE